MDRLTMGVHFMGFSADTCRRLAAWLEEGGSPDTGWQVVPVEQADVCCMATDPAIARLFRGTMATALILRPPSEQGRAAVPGARELVVHSGISGCLFDAGRRDCVLRTFHELEAALAPTLTPCVLGEILVKDHARLTRGEVFHVQHRDQLIAVVDASTQRVGLSPRAAPREARRAQWHRRPPGAACIPAGFVVRAPWELRWDFAVRTQCRLLPATYRRKAIHLRPVSQAQIDRMSVGHLQLVSHLRSGPAPLRQICSRLSLPVRPTERLLGALYVAGAISTDPADARDGPAAA